MIVIIGAGPAGLATAYHLQRRGLPHRLLEKHSIGWSWRNHYDSLALHTLKDNSALPGLPMPATFPDFPTRAQVVEYLAGYAHHFQLNIETGVTVQRAFFQDGFWRLQTNRGRETAVALVAATGIWSTPRCPHFPGEESFRGQIMHANAYKNARPFRGQRVLVVGVGNTGAELAAELGSAGVETGIVVRNGAAFGPHPGSAVAMDAAAWLARTLPAPLVDAYLRRVRPNFAELGLPLPPGPPSETYPVVGFDLPQAVEAGQVQVYPAIERLLPHGACFVDGREAPFDAVILATGYRPTLDFIDPTPTLDGHGRIAQPEQFPRLYTVGFHYPATAGWLQSIGRVSARVADQISREAGHLAALEAVVATAVNAAPPTPAAE